MTIMIGELDLETAATQIVGNWQTFDSFCWHRAGDIEGADQFCIVYTHHRDNGLIDQSNAAVIRKTMELFLGKDALEQRHDHWAVGWIEGYAIRVYRDGQITGAFRAWHELSCRRAEYPILDEDDYDAKEYDATVENIANAAWRQKKQYDLPDGWEHNVYDWLSDHEPGEIESRDDRGGYPSVEAILRAIDALNYHQVGS